MENELDTTLYQNIRETLIEARKQVHVAVNAAMVQAYWHVGKQIADTQGEDDRAEYGSKQLKLLADKLTSEFGNGFTLTNLKYMRQFYYTFPIGHALRDQLSWTHYRLLIKVEKSHIRDFYIEECINGNWSTRQLERQINSFFYERLLSSQNKDAVRSEIHRLEKPMDIKEIIKDPYVLEFLGLEQSPALYEKDLEKNLIAHLQKLLLELGRGFTFEARQKRITLDHDHFYIDLVFYNYILKCFVLIDLKIGRLSHQDIGQMQMYVNYYTREMMNEGDNSPVGIILCADKNESVVKYTLPVENNQIFASRYKLVLPTEDELKSVIAQQSDEPDSFIDTDPS